MYSVLSKDKPVVIGIIIGKINQMLRVRKRGHKKNKLKEIERLF